MLRPLDTFRERKSLSLCRERLSFHLSQEKRTYIIYTRLLHVETNAMLLSSKRLAGEKEKKDRYSCCIYHFQRGCRFLLFNVR